MRNVGENEKKKNVNLEKGGAEWYREKIEEMIKQIEEKRFLKAIYISISEYIKENEPV
ncbi:MAG: hypothetical protein HFI82_00690 [Eubacterium sp.]|jgi:hypothetical protein|nr:hypothetical protein [Eubacterium sp.]